MALLGSYLGGIGANEGELNPLQWDWKAPETYLGIGFGGLFGYVGGYGLVHPGIINLAIGIGTPIGGVYLVGNQSDWSFQWSTVAGGGGEVEVGEKHEAPPIRMPDMPKWDGPFLQGTKEDAIEMLIFDSKYLGIETSIFCTNKGYYFDVYSGTNYYFDYDELSLYTHSGPVIFNYNKEGGYFKNDMSHVGRYLRFNEKFGNLYISPRMFEFARIIWAGHTHPRSGPPMSADLLFARLYGCPMYVFGWNGTIYQYGGYGYWK